MEEETLDTRTLPPDDPNYTGPDPMSGVAGVDHGPLGAALMITPAGRAVSGAVNTAKTAIDVGKKAWQSPQMKGIRTSDFIQNLGSGGNASRMQKTVKPIEQVGNAIDEVFSLAPAEFRKIINLNKKSGFTTKDLADNFNTIQELLRPNLEANFDAKILDVNTWTIPQGYKRPRQDTLKKVGGNLFKRLNEREQIGITEILTGLEDYHQRGLEGQNKTGWNPQKPTRGYSSNRILKTEKGLEIGIGWNGKEQSYYLFDFKKNERALKGRYRADTPADDPWSKTKSQHRRQSIKIKNRDALAALNRIKTEHPNLYLDIVGSMSDPNTVWTAEHINSRNSGVWIEQEDGRLIHRFKKKSDGSDLFFGDSENIMPATGTNYGSLKTAMENSSIIQNSNYYIDIDPKTRNFFLASRTTGKPHSFRADGKVVQINGMTSAHRWEEVLLNVMRGGDEIGLVDSMIDNPGDQAILLETNAFGRYDPNTRLEPVGGQIELDEETKIQQELEYKINQLPKGLRERIWDIKERLDAHNDGTFPIKNKSILTRYKNEFRDAVFQLNLPGFSK